MANVEVKAHRLARWGAVEITGRTLNVTTAKVKGDSGQSAKVIKKLAVVR